MPKRGNRKESVVREDDVLVRRAEELFGREHVGERLILSTENLKEIADNCKQISAENDLKCRIPLRVIKIKGRRTDSSDDLTQKGKLEECEPEKKERWTIDSQALVRALALCIAAMIRMAYTKFRPYILAGATITLFSVFLHFFVTKDPIKNKLKHAIESSNSVFVLIFELANYARFDSDSFPDPLRAFFWGICATMAILSLSPRTKQKQVVEEKKKKKIVSTRSLAQRKKRGLKRK